MKIGFIGLGNMGGPMCSRLVTAGYDVIAFDVNEEAVSRVVALGASRGASGVDCARRADILLTSLPKPEHVQSVMGESIVTMRSGSLWVDLTTNRRELLESLAESARKTSAIPVMCPIGSTSEVSHSSNFLK